MVPPHLEGLDAGSRDCIGPLVSRLLSGTPLVERLQLLRVELDGRQVDRPVLRGSGCWRRGGRPHHRHDQGGIAEIENLLRRS